MSILLVIYMNDVEAGAGLDQIAGAALRHGKCRLVEFRQSPALLNPAQRSTVGSTRIFGIFLCKIFEFSSRLSLLKYVRSLRTRLFDDLRINFPIGSGWCLNQNVPYID